jgi:hypothetical protein
MARMVCNVDVWGRMMMMVMMMMKMMNQLSAYILSVASGQRRN